MPRGLLIAVVVALLAVAGVVEGIRTNRWGDSEDIRAAAAKLDGVPRAVGPWVSTESPIDEKVLRVARCAGHVSRVYTNTQTGESVAVLVLCGPTGDIAAHTPDVCYAANGYEMRGPKTGTRQTLPDAGASYWTARFEKPNSGDPALEACWAWGTNGDWTAVENPRIDFVRHTALYKFYVSRPLPLVTGAGKPDPAREFLSVFLPELRKLLAANVD